MELITKAPKGTVDIIPGESEKWSLVEAVMTDEAELNGFSEIRTPVFEHTELFLRSVGDTTDVVEKQMYTFEDKGGRSITLRPEGTAGTVRAMLENGLDIRRVITHRFKVDEFEKGFAAMRSGLSGKVVLDWQ